MWERATCAALLFLTILQPFLDHDVPWLNTRSSRPGNWVLDLYIFRAPGPFVTRTDTVGSFKQGIRLVRYASLARASCHQPSSKAMTRSGSVCEGETLLHMTGSGSLRLQISLLAAERTVVTQTEHASPQPMQPARTLQQTQSQLQIVCCRGPQEASQIILIMDNGYTGAMQLSIAEVYCYLG
jgi:hypothetical protein